MVSHAPLSPDLEAERKAKRAASKKAYYEANREKVLAANKAYYEANREKVLAANKAYYEANREKVLAANKAYYEANREKVLAAHKASCENLNDSYVARTIALPTKKVPPDLIELKRQQLLLSRSLKQLTQEMKHGQ